MNGVGKGLSLHLNSDIPVVELDGEWDDTTGYTITEVIAYLVHAGHVQIIINLTRLKHALPADADWVEQLEKITTTIRSRCGSLDLVGTVDQIQQYVRRKTRTTLFWSASEEEAVGRIKRLPIHGAGAHLSMRLVR